MRPTLAIANMLYSRLASTMWRHLSKEPQFTPEDRSGNEKCIVVFILNLTIILKGIVWLWKCPLKFVITNCAPEAPNPKANCRNDYFTTRITCHCHANWHRHICFTLDRRILYSGVSGLCGVLIDRSPWWQHHRNGHILAEGSNSPFVRRFAIHKPDAKVYDFAVCCAIIRPARSMYVCNRTCLFGSRCKLARGGC